MNCINTCEIIIRGRAVKMNKYQIGAFTQKVIQQLQADPKVVILPYSSPNPVNNCVSYSLIKESDRDVPDLSNVASYIECTSVEDSSFDEATNIERRIEEKNTHSDFEDSQSFGSLQNDKNNTSIDIANIELELGKMFYVDDNSSNQEKTKTDNVATSSKLRKIRKIRKSVDLKELFIQLFGNPLDDIELTFTPKKIQQASRRHTLPVSINIPNEEFLEPLKVSKKRKSENDINISTVCKIKKRDVKFTTMSELPSVEFTVTSLLIKPEANTTTEKADESVSVSDLKTAIVIDHPVIEYGCKQEMQAMEVTLSTNEIIDLTEDDNGMETSCPAELVDDVENKLTADKSIEASSSSEKADVPVPTISAPLISPVSPTEPGQSEATLPETTNTACMANLNTNRDQPFVVVQRVSPEFHSSSQRPPPQMISLLPSTAKPSQTEESARHAALDESQLMSLLRPRTTTTTTVQPNPSVGFQTVNPSLLATQLRSRLLDGVKTTHNQQAPNHQSVQRRQSGSKQIMEQHSPSTAASTSPQTSLSQGFVHHQNVNLQTTLSSIMKTAQQQLSQYQVSEYQNQRQSTQHQSVPSQLSMPNYQVYQRQTSNSNGSNQFLPSNQQPNQMAPVPPAPQLIRMYPLVQPRYKFCVISNTACGEILFPHLYVFGRWRASTNRFVDEAQTFLTARDFKEDNAIFCIYVNHTLDNFGKKLIRDLITVDVENFNLSEICTVIVAKLQEKSCMANIYRVCLNIHLMIKSCERYCSTPFTKKFFTNIKMCIERMEARSQRVFPSFTLLQLKQLETQIRQYWAIRNWTDTFHRRRMSQMSQAGHQVPPPPSYPGKSQPKKQKHRESHNSLQQSLEQTALKVYKQHQNQRDRSGKNDNLATRPLLTLNSDNLKQNSSEKVQNVPQISRQESYQVPVQAQPSSPQISGPLPSMQKSRQESDQVQSSGPQISGTVPSMQKSRQESDQVQSSGPQISGPVPSLQKSHQESVQVQSSSLPNVPNEANANKSTASRQETSVIVFQHTSTRTEEPHPEDKNASSAETSSKNAEQHNEDIDIIDLTWIDDGDENEMLEEITECKLFPFKAEDYPESDSGSSVRETVSPADSGLGSPNSQVDSGDYLKCLCGKQAIYICACKFSMYCGAECQINDWNYHQRLCQEMKKS